MNRSHPMNLSSSQQTPPSLAYHPLCTFAIKTLCFLNHILLATMAEFRSSSPTPSDSNGRSQWLREMLLERRDCAILGKLNGLRQIVCLFLFSYVQVTEMS
jgi:hypothetical protein